MRDYINLQLDYLLSKITVIIVFILLTVIILSSLYNAQVIEGYGYIDGFRNEFGFDYLNETYIIIEFILVFLSIFFGMILAGKSNQSLMMYSVYSKKTKLYHIISRILAGMLMIFILIVFVSLTILLITYSLTPYKIAISMFLKINYLLIIELLQYFMMTLILMTIINHFIFGLLSLFIFWLREILSYDFPDHIKNILDYIIININGYDYQEKNILICLFIFNFFLISYIIVMQKKDC